MMKMNRFLRLLLCQFFFAPAVQTEELDPTHLSPDGRFRFEAFSTASYDAGEKPAFGIIEVSTAKLVSNPMEELGNPYRPEETILWAPDSQAYALTSRVGTRHLATFLYRWDGSSFVLANWEDDSLLETKADAELRKEMVSLGFSADTGLGRCIRGDGLAERWLDPHRIVVTSVQEYLVGDDQREEVVGGSSRAIVKWNDASSSYRIERELAVREPWPYPVEDAGSYEVIQSDRGGDDPNARVFTIRHRENGESKQFEAENWLSSPVLLESYGGWPQLELVSHGPTGFIMRRLYRLVDGDYHCVRLDEFTRLSHQAPEGAQLVEMGLDSSAYFIRTRAPEAGGTDTYESFQTESMSPDGKWTATFLYHPQYLQRAEIVAADASGDPINLYDFDGGEGGTETVASVIWSPDSTAFALYLQDGPRAGYTLLYRLSNTVWSQTAMPAIEYDFLKPAHESGTVLQVQRERPLWWNGPRELIIELSGHLHSDEEAPDYRAFAALSWDDKGKPLTCVTTPLE